jgi:hypothetical protein
MEPITVQAVFTLIGALITGATSIAVAFIQRPPERQGRPEGEAILLPRGVVVHRPARLSIQWIVLFITTGALVGFLLGSAVRSLVFPAQVVILSPRDHSQIPCAVAECPVMVEGTVNGLREGQAVWVLVFPLVNNSFYYPQPGPVAVDVNGHWTSPAIIGIYTADKGIRFDIYVVIADKDAQSVLSTRERQSRVPDGAVIYQRISVTRD